MTRVSRRWLAGMGACLVLLLSPLLIHVSGQVLLRHEISDPLIASLLQAGPDPESDPSLPEDCFSASLFGLQEHLRTVDGQSGGYILHLAPSTRWLDVPLRRMFARITTALLPSLLALPTDHSTVFDSLPLERQQCILAFYGMQVGDPGSLAVMDRLDLLACLDRHDWLMPTAMDRWRTFGLLYAHANGQLPIAWEHLVDGPSPAPARFERVLSMRMINASTAPLLRTLAGRTTPGEPLVPLRTGGWLWGGWRAALTLRHLRRLVQDGWWRCPIDMPLGTSGEQLAAAQTAPRTPSLIDGLCRWLGLDEEDGDRLTSRVFGARIPLARQDAVFAAVEADAQWRCCQALDRLVDTYRRTGALPSTAAEAEATIGDRLWHGRFPGTDLRYQSFTPSTAALAVAPGSLLPPPGPTPSRPPIAGSEALPWARVVPGENGVSVGLDCGGLRLAPATVSPRP